MTTRPTPIVHASIAAAREFYKFRRIGYSHEEAYAACNVVNYVAYWGAA